MDTLRSASVKPRRPSSIKAQSYAGFTLLELLIALSLTAMLLTMLTAGVYGVVRDWDNNAAGLENSLEETVAILQIERALQGAFPHSYRDPETLGRHVYFDGEAQSLSWVSTVSPQRASGLTAWRISADSDDGLTLQLAPALTDNPDIRLDDARAVSVLSGYDLQIQYLFETVDFERQWRDEWDGSELQSLPMAVHVKLLPLDRNTNKPTLDIVAPIMATLHRSIQPAQDFLR